MIVSRSRPLNLLKVIAGRLRGFYRDGHRCGTSRIYLVIQFPRPVAIITDRGTRPLQVQPSRDRPSFCLMLTVDRGCRMQGEAIKRDSPV